MKRAYKTWRQLGLKYVLWMAKRPILGIRLLKAAVAEDSFLFRGRTFRYFYHKYNVTWIDERAVEVPIVWEIVQRYHGKRILEVGNVLSHYFASSHDILDKYEVADGIANEDVADFNRQWKYDLIVSISTIEHVGFDERPVDSGKIPRAIGNLKRHLAEGGKIVVTVPVGWNPHLDKLLVAGALFDCQFYLKRISRDNKWLEVDSQSVFGLAYGRPYECANGLVVGIVGHDDLP